MNPTQQSDSPQQIVITLDASQVKQFMICPRSWYWKYFRSIIPIGGHVSPALSFGTAMHGLLDCHYVGLSKKLPPMESHALAIDYAKKHFSPSVPGGMDKLVYQKLISKFTTYVIQYQDSDFQPMVSPGGKIFVELGFSYVLFESAKYKFILEGRIDLVDTSTGAPTIVDHKTQSSKYLLHERDPQPLTYCFVANVRNAVFNYIGTQDNYKREYNHRQPFHFSRMTLDWWGEKLLRNFEKVAEALESGDFETNETQCMGKFSPCEYTRLCRVHSNWETIVQHYYQPKQEWKPWTLEELGDNPLVQIEGAENG